MSDFLHTLPCFFSNKMTDIEKNTVQLNQPQLGNFPDSRNLLSADQLDF